MPEQQNAHRSPEQADDSVAPAHALPLAESRRPSPLLWTGLALLLLVALGVIFVLPVVVSEYELPLERRAELAPQPVAPAVSQAPEELSPFEEAVLARERQRAQDVLALILDTQAELEPLQVEEWAGEAYDAALEVARAGDETYRNREFEQANASYQEAAGALNELLESVPERLEQALAAAEEALLDGEPELAGENFSLALLLDPGNTMARSGLERTANYEEFAASLQRAIELAQAGDLQESLAAYREAAGLDPASREARDGVADMTRRIRQAEFSAVMSAGFAMLDAGDPEAAIAEFERAAGLSANNRVNNEQAQAAIEQTRNQVASVEIERLRGRIGNAEQSEQWQQAAETYDEVLAIDANVVFALNGRDYAARRALLDSLLAEAIANPYRFNEDEVYREALDVYYTGRSIENPGPKLVGQLDQLEGLLANSQIPVAVSFASDNLTSVTILRVAELGFFEQASLSLKPGRYVALGRRIGYREVREEFTVGYGQTPAQVVVQCVDRLGVRR